MIIIIKFKALFTGGLKIGVSKFRGTISTKIMGYEPSHFFWCAGHFEKARHTKKLHPTQSYPPHHVIA
jgi:hypothetical protein